MPLSTGTRLGVYEVTAKIGEGGMGEVYQARDTKLDRDVALKVLPDAFTADPDRLARFEREAKVLASLNHPNIGTIYGLAEDGDTRALVLELVEGSTLADRIALGPIPADDALPIARQIAEALEAAHEAGVIHRDLKPANIKVREDGTVKVLDFGLAKALDTAPEGDPSQSPTLTAAATQMGVILGTAAYMAPEQARGKPVDKRADIWAFGAVVYEMLTGNMPFPGDDVSQTLARVIDREPDWDTMPSALPAGVSAFLRRCLRKDLRQRVRDIGDVRLALDGAFEPDGLPGDAQRPTALQVASSPVGLLLLLATAAALLVAVTRPTGESATPIAVPTQITRFSTVAAAPAVSPNGQMLAFTADEPQGTDSQIWIKSLPDGPPQQLTRTPGKKVLPAFSPDGSRVAYTLVGDENRWDTWIVPIIGGEPRLMMRNANSLTWMPGGGLIFSEFKQGRQLAIVTSDESGADRHDVWVPAPHQMAHHSAVSPDGQSVIIGYMGVGPLSPDRNACFVRPLTDEGADEVRVIGGGERPCGMFAQWSRDGEWIYFVSAGNEIWREPARGGSAERVFGGLDLSLGEAGAFADFSLMPNGESLVLAGGQEQRNLWLRASTGLETQLTFNDDASEPTFSDDGNTIYFVAAPRGGSGAVWRYGVDDKRREQVCTGLTASELAVTPDGRHLVLVQTDDGRRQLWVCAVDGADPPRRLLATDRGQRNPLVSPDGSTVYFRLTDGLGGALWRVGLDGSESRPISEEMADFRLSSVSPDGEWLSVSHREQAPREAWLHPTSGEGEPRFLLRGWQFHWAPENRVFMFNNIGSLSTTWMLENPDGFSLPADLPEFPTGEWFRDVGAQRVSTGRFFSTPSPSPRPFEIVEPRIDARSNLYRLDLKP